MSRPLALATGGDDYEIVCAVRPDQVLAIQDEARAAGLALTVIGRFAQGTGVTALASGRPMPLDRLGWDHGA